MGLDISHDTFSGAYSSFNRFRQIIAKAMGGSWPPHDDPTHDPNLFYYPEGWDHSAHPGLGALMTSNDCEGKISPADAGSLADEMEALLPEIDKHGSGGGHLERDDGYGAVARKFIAGCRAAAAAGEALEFH